MKTIRPLLILLGLVLACPATFSQQGKKPAPEENLYYRALFASLDKMESSWGNQIDGDATRMRTDYHDMIVEANRDITDGLPAQLGAYRVAYLDDLGLIARYKTLRKEFPMPACSPCETTVSGSELLSTFTRLATKSVA
jgi:hypothetical protein